MCLKREKSCTLNTTIYMHFVKTQNEAELTMKIASVKNVFYV